MEAATDTAAGRRAEPAASRCSRSTNLVKHFPIKSGIVVDRQVGAVQAVDDVSFAVAEGETLGLVGESGCGKSTLARSILQLIRPTSGSVRFRGTELTEPQPPPAAPAAPRDADDLPGPLRVAQPAQARRPDRRRPAEAARDRLAATSSKTASRSCSSGSGSRPSTTTASRTSSRAASGSGSGSRARSRWSRR